MESRAQRRLHTLRNHLLNSTAAGDHPPHLRHHPAAGEFSLGHYVVTCSAQTYYLEYFLNSH